MMAIIGRQAVNAIFSAGVCDSATPVEIFVLPTTKNGYLELVRTIVAPMADRKKSVLDFRLTPKPSL